MVRDVATDLEGLRMAAKEMFEETLKPSSYIPEDAANREQIIASLTNPRTLSPGYYARVAYLIELEETIDVVSMTLSDIRPSELAGLKIIKEARNEFNDKYPQCSCGNRNYKFAGRCKGCKTEFQRRSHGGSHSTRG